MGVAVAIDGQPIDVLHDEIGSAIGAHASVEETSNVGVVELGQDLTLGAKALSKEMSTEVSADDLQSNITFELAVGAMSEVNGAHAALTDFAVDAVIAEV